MICDTILLEPPPIHMCDMIHDPYAWRDSVMCVMSTMSHVEMNNIHIICDTILLVSPPIYMCDMIHDSYARRDSFICVMSTMSGIDTEQHSHDSRHCLPGTSRSYVWHDSYAWRDSFIGVTCFIRVTWLRHLRYVDNEQCWHDSRHYWVAATSRLLKIIGLFCKRDL